MITAERVRELLHYDPETGVFTWICNRGRPDRIGQTAGTLMKVGYVCISVDSKRYYAHRLAWLHVHGVWPPEQIDHRNRNRSDNRLSNLRPATDEQNKLNLPVYRNNKSGHPGVIWSERHSKWRAEIKHKGRNAHLGLFKDLEAAVAARQNAERTRYWSVTSESAQQ